MSLDPSRFAHDEHVNTNWTVTVEAGTSLDDVMNTAFFANIASKLQPYDHIRVRVDTDEWYAELLVVSCGRVWAKTIKLLHVKLVSDEAEPEDVDSQYLIEFKGPHKKWVVIRKADKEIIREGCANKQDANVWLASHLITL